MDLLHFFQVLGPPFLPYISIDVLLRVVAVVPDNSRVLSRNSAENFAANFSELLDKKRDRRFWTKNELSDALEKVGRLRPFYERKVAVRGVLGLLWPEARERIANTAYATAESVGRGQVILFAADPTFRTWLPGIQRLFFNAVLLGPGMGTSWPVPW